jgi:hypothetical protein
MREDRMKDEMGIKDICGRLNEFAKILRPEAVDFCQRLIRTPAASGQEKAVADLYLAEMKKVGCDKSSEMSGKCIGIINRLNPGPPLCTTAIWIKSADEPSAWNGYGPYGASIDVTNR